MKKIVALTIALCLVFTAVVPAYAATEVVNSAWNTFFSNINSNVSTIKTYLQDFTQSWTTFFETMTGGTPSSLLTFQDLVRDVLRIGDWLAPIADYTDGLRPSGILSIWDTLQSTMASVISNTSYNAVSQARLTDLAQSLTNYYYSYGTNQISSSEIAKNGHAGLLTYDSSTGKYKLVYSAPIIGYAGNQTSVSTSWAWGTPLGNVAWMLKNHMQSFVNESGYINRVGLTHYGDTLTTWDSQGDSLTQVTFTPDSAIQGLYRYLAFTQRDVARLSYVFSNDAELQAREYAQGTQNTVTDLFINPDSDSSAKQTDFASVSDQSELARNNLSTGYSAYGIWGGFDPGVYSGTDGWFTQTTANNLDTTTSVSSTRSTKSIQPIIKEDYSTPLLDAYYEEIYSLQGGLDD